ncbi:hypothetical protein ACIBEJ_25090 [Nonomuraea sp. NPDC050790]|uniref:hypothetical protein n=1 Tax=Nonomuraea sp. NPDC050790 TaxID=3364371 RepID=UPI0037A009D4
MREETPANRTGRPEIDALLDTADAEHQALAELQVIGQAEHVVTGSRHAALAAEHQALCERVRRADDEMRAAQESGAADRIAAAAEAQDRTWADFHRRSPALIAEAQRLLRARLEHTGAVLGQVGTAWAAEARARDALAGRHQPEATDPPRPDDPADGREEA